MIRRLLCRLLGHAWLEDHRAWDAEVVGDDVFVLRIFRCLRCRATWEAGYHAPAEGTGLEWALRAALTYQRPPRRL